MEGGERVKSHFSQLLTRTSGVNRAFPQYRVVKRQEEKNAEWMSARLEVVMRSRDRNEKKRRTSAVGLKSCRKTSWEDNISIPQGGE